MCVRVCQSDFKQCLYVSVKFKRRVLKRHALANGVLRLLVESDCGPGLVCTVHRVMERVGRDDVPVVLCDAVDHIAHRAGNAISLRHLHPRSISAILDGFDSEGTMPSPCQKPLPRVVMNLPGDRRCRLECEETTQPDALADEICLGLCDSSAGHCIG